MKSLIAYYSYHGNKKRIAELITKDTDTETLRIETVVPYEGSYNKVVN